jgi:hypothetical protein
VKLAPAADKLGSLKRTKPRSTEQVALERLEQVCGNDMRPLGRAYDVVSCDAALRNSAEMQRAGRGSRR